MGKGNGPPWLVADDLWGRIEPLLPVRTRRRCYPGRLPLDDRKCLQGILFVLHSGIQWEWLPQELGFGSGMTCWRLRDWPGCGTNCTGCYAPPTPVPGARRRYRQR